MSADKFVALLKELGYPGAPAKPATVGAKKDKNSATFPTAQALDWCGSTPFASLRVTRAAGPLFLSKQDRFLLGYART